MGIYIKGIDMPTNATGCEVIIRIQPDGTVLDEHGVHLYAKAVPIPSHGDLIDRKAAYDSLLYGMVMTGYQSRALDCISEFYAPTIIEAEPPKEEKDGGHDE